MNTEEPEIVNFFVSVFLFIYAQHLLRKYSIRISRYWLICIYFLLGSNLLTLLEGLAFGSMLNILEHVFFLLACLCFLLAVLTKSKAA